jgi:hypothetical protein
LHIRFNVITANAQRNDVVQLRRVWQPQAAQALRRLSSANLAGPVVASENIPFAEAGICPAVPFCPSPRSVALVLFPDVPLCANLGAIPNPQIPVRSRKRLKAKQAFPNDGRRIGSREFRRLLLSIFPAAFDGAILLLGLSFQILLATPQA